MTNSHDTLGDLIDTLDHLAGAGIDSAFDGGCEELERYYAELRLTFDDRE